MVVTTRKARRDSPITGLMAGWYARLTKREMAEFSRLAERIAGQLPPQADVLEVAPGPGYWAVEMARLGAFQVVGLDLSADFVRMATANAQAAGVEVEFREGNAARMPLASDAFDFVLCRAAFKNFADPLGALNEMHRVLRPGGQALIIDLRRDASPVEINEQVEKMDIGAVNRAITRLIFKYALLKRAYSREEFEQLAAESKFGASRIDVDSIGLEVWLTK